MLVAATATGSELELSIPLVVASAVAAVIWIGVLLVVLAVRRVPVIHGVGAGIDLPPESPAVAGMLINDFTVPSETGPAILLDLAARRIIDLDEVQPGRTICRVRPRADTSQLTAAEKRVLAAIANRAIDGVVPAEALTSGPEEQSKSWHRALARDVVQESQAGGLSVNRWPKGLVTFLGVCLAIPGALLGLAFTSEHVVRDSEVTTLVIAGAIAVVVLVLGSVAVGRLGTSIAQLPTPSGETAAARAGGLEEHLAEDRPLAELPPAAVTLRGRHFAYAAAFGAARLAVELLPMGAEDDHRAWSRFGGRWRRVRVRYPRSFPPAWGKHPGFALFLALVWGGLAIAAIRGIDAITGSNRPIELTRGEWDDVTTVVNLLLVPVALVLAWALWVAVRALPDLWTRQTVTGEIVRARRYRQWAKSGDNPKYWYYLAVDDGSDASVVAWRVRSDIWSAHAQGQTVVAEITPRLRYVRSISRA